MKGFFYYQNPGETVIHGFECSVVQVDSILDFKEGFVVTSFNKEKVYNLLPNEEISLDKLDKIQLEDDEFPLVRFGEYNDLIQRAVSFCGEEQGKVVVSRILSEVFPEDYSLKTFFLDLCEKYEHSFNYCFHLENDSTWVGATPEVLVRCVKQECSIYSLAGSRDVNAPFEWTEKEKSEQRFVTQEIAETLERLSIAYDLKGPETVRAGNLEHLLSEFTFESNDALAVADQLHPTPAVCGTPRDKAFDFISKNESHDRKYYTGIIGWKKGDDISLYVNLRCAELTSGKIHCYVGGGITKDSTGEKEWEETRIKSQTLLSVLKKN